MGFWSRAFAAALVATQVVGALCHGFLAVPAARNVVHNSNYCAHCLSAGGPGVTYGGGRTWPNSRHGVCGDPAAGPLDHEAGGKFATRKITGTYRRGQVVTLRVKMTAPHGGRFSFGLCPVPDGATPAVERRAVTQKCLDSNRMINVDTGTPYWWYGKRGSGEYTMNFRLPPTLVCKRCVLQWHYETGNSCTIPGTPPGLAMSPNMASCKGSTVMEEFWNCADVTILDGPAGPAAKPPSKPPAAKTRSKPRDKKSNEEAPTVVQPYARPAVAGLCSWPWS